MPWPKVQPGDKLRIPAGLHNATVEAVEAYLRHKTATGGTMGRRAPTQALVLVSNDTGADLAIGGVVGLDGPIWPGYNTDPDPGTAGEKFFLGAELVFSGIEPTAAAHTGRFAVAVEPILNGAAGRACVQGVVKVKVQIDDLNVATWADVTDVESGYLTATASGSARILWHEGAGTGTVWCICLIGCGTNRGCFPVDLAQVGGTDGNATTAASWTYDVTDPMAPEDADPLAEAANPTSSPHKWVRPTGVMTKATFGHAHFNKAGALVIGWINEVAAQEACP